VDSELFREIFSSPRPIRAIVEIDYYDGIELGFLALAEPPIAFVIQRFARTTALHWLYIAWRLPDAAYDEVASLGEAIPGRPYRYFTLEHPNEPDRTVQLAASAAEHPTLLLEVDLDTNVVRNAYQVERLWTSKPRFFPTNPESRGDKDS
jgi:hypothetical protein